ncbi:YtkA-like protein [Halobacteriovorax sp. BALOs_7]|uniref:hypothetical protein n=1 Tax=Halobacteriovorax sp. BALOs_7 TaxID=2109558 RepID=UPI000E9FFA1F|nr:hypothetical protein [Halobacteriovorax sp. BALOs_7]AYF45589.1 YtkA-like protein [Halobacteriovorax sp. BALOs_7]
MRFFSLILFSLFVISCGDSPFTGKLSDPFRGDDSITTALRFETESLTISREWKKGPLLYDSSKITISLTDSAGNFTDPIGNFKAYLWMPNMGHGSYPISINKLATGIYELTDVYFTMGGLWDFHLQLEENGNIYDSVSWPLTL